jgi:hypothetical protein
MEPNRSLETSDTNQPMTQRNISEEQNHNHSVVKAQELVSIFTTYPAFKVKMLDSSINILRFFRNFFHLSPKL